MKLLQNVKFTVPLASTASEVLMATAGDFGSGGVMRYRIVHGFWTLIQSQFLNMDTSVTDPSVLSTEVSLL